MHQDIRRDGKADGDPGNYASSDTESDKPERQSWKDKPNLRWEAQTDEVKKWFKEKNKNPVHIENKMKMK